VTLLLELHDLRVQFLTALKAQVLFEKDFTGKLKSSIGTPVFPADQAGTVNVADVTNYVSSRIAWEWAKLLPGPFHASNISGQTAGDRFTSEVRKYLERSIVLCQQLRKTNWRYVFEETNTSKRGRTKAKNPRIKASSFAQYAHLSRIEATFKNRPDLEAVFGADYIVEPDIVVFSLPFEIESLGGRPSQPVARYSPLISDAEYATGEPLLQASVSCKLTIRSDRAQNARLEALNLIRTRKGRAPNIAFVTAEPLPSRITSLALGTGDLDCIYHAGLHELIEAVDAALVFGAERLPDDEVSDDLRTEQLVEPEDEVEADSGATEATPTKSGLRRQKQRLHSMIAQGRLRDVSDLVLDLLI
jgi:NgoMIV restriction enzyme